MIRAVEETTDAAPPASSRLRAFAAVAACVLLAWLPLARWRFEGAMRPSRSPSAVAWVAGFAYEGLRAGLAQACLPLALGLLAAALLLRSPDAQPPGRRRAGAVLVLVTLIAYGRYTITDVVHRAGTFAPDAASLALPEGVAGAAALLGWSVGAGVLWALAEVGTRARLANGASLGLALSALTSPGAFAAAYASAVGGDHLSVFGLWRVALPLVLVAVTVFALARGSPPRWPRHVARGFEVLSPVEVFAIPWIVYQTTALSVRSLALSASMSALTTAGVVAWLWRQRPHRRAWWPLVLAVFCSARVAWALHLGLRDEAGRLPAHVRYDLTHGRWGTTVELRGDAPSAREDLPMILARVRRQRVRRVRVVEAEADRIRLFVGEEAAAARAALAKAVRLRGALRLHCLATDQRPLSDVPLDERSDRDDLLEHGVDHPPTHALGGLAWRWASHLPAGPDAEAVALLAARSRSVGGALTRVFCVEADPDYGPGGCVAVRLDPAPIFTEADLWFIQQPWYGRSELHAAFLEGHRERAPCVSGDVALLLDEELLSATTMETIRARPAWSIRAARLALAQSFNEAWRDVEGTRPLSARWHLSP
jgi:hypothetical protein